MSKLGVNFPSRSAFETALKRPLDTVRCYNIADARKAAAEGRKVTFSFKPTHTWAQCATGVEDAADLAIAQEVAGWGPGHILAKQHEPENDGQTAASFVAMETRFRSVVEPVLHAAGSRWAMCYIGFTFNGTNPGQWIGTLKPDVFAIDAYLWRGATGPYAPTEKTTNQNTFTKFLDFAKANGHAHPELWEFGCSRTEADTAGVHRSEELERFAANPRMEEFETIIYFESPPPVVDWEIRNEPRSMAAFASLGSPIVTPPVDPCQDVKIALAAAEEAIESLEESNNALTDALAVMTNQRDVAHAKIDAAVAALT